MKGRIVEFILRQVLKVIGDLYIGNEKILLFKIVFGLRETYDTCLNTFGGPYGPEQLII